MSNNTSREMKQGFWRTILHPRRIAQALGAAVLVAVNPRQLARAVRRLFRSASEKRQEEETRRTVQIRMGRVRIRRLIAQQRTLEKRLLDLAKRAVALGDEARFRQLGKQVLQVRQNIRRWERYLLTLEMLEARRDQARASVELVEAVKAINASLESLTAPEDITALQQSLEKSLAQAATVEERTEVMLEAMDAALDAEMPLDETSLADLQQTLTDEVIRDEQATFDPEIEEELRRIRADLEQK